MGYGSIYADRTISYLTEREVKYLDRLFMKALVKTSFGRKLKEKLDDEDCVFLELSDRNQDMIDGAETLYQQTGLYVFGDNEFAFREFNDTKEYKMSLSELERKPLFVPSIKVIKRLPESFDKALYEIERRGTPSKVKPDVIYKGPEFRNGAWQLYSRVRELVPRILPKNRDRRTIKQWINNEVFG